MGYLDYSQQAKVLLEMMDNRLLKTYETCILNQPTGYYIKNKVMRLKENEDLNLEKIIIYQMKQAISDVGYDVALVSEKAAQSVFKKNWLKTLAEELGPVEKIKPRNPRALQKEAELLFEMARYNRDDSTTLDYSSVRDMMEKKYQVAVKLYKESDSFITDFIYMKTKTPKTQATAFLHDLTHECLQIIKNKFGGNPAGYAYIIPQFILDEPAISYRNSPTNFELKVIENELQLTSSYQYEDGEVIWEINTETEGTSLSKDDIKKAQAGLTIEIARDPVDTKDLLIIGGIYNSFNDKVLTDKVLQIELRDFCAKTFHVASPRKELIIDVEERIFKLEHIHTRATMIDANGNTIQKLSYNYSAGTKLVVKENGKKYIDIYPSPILINSFYNEQHIKILSQKFNLLDSSQTKAIVMLVQNERISNFMKNGQLNFFLPYKFFRNHLQISMTTYKLKKELALHFDRAKKIDLLFKDYKFQKTGVHIYCKELEQLEYIVYNITSPYNESIDIDSGEPIIGMEDYKIHSEKT